MSADYDKLFKPLDDETDSPPVDFADGGGAGAGPAGWDEPVVDDGPTHGDLRPAGSDDSEAGEFDLPTSAAAAAAAPQATGGEPAFDTSVPPIAAPRRPPARPWPTAPAIGRTDSAAAAGAADALHRPVLPPLQTESQTDGRTEIVTVWPGADTAPGAARAAGTTRQPLPAPPQSQGHADRTEIVNVWPVSDAVANLPEPASAATIGNQRAVDGFSQVDVRTSVKMPSQRGWRHVLYVLTRINLGLSPDEVYEMDLHNRIRRNARDSYQIGVFGLKGGVGKTAVTIALGSALAEVRGDRILAVDADPDGGNLADRCGRESAATIADLLADRNLARYNDIRAYTSMNRANLEVLSSDDYSVARRPFGPEEWNGVTNIVSRYYNLVLADCGAGLFHPAARSVLNTVSGLVIVASASIDGARQAAITMDWLRQNGYQHLLGRTCVVINHITPGKSNVDIADLIQQFERHVTPGRVVELPWDKHIAAGTAIDLDLLGPTFQRRVIELAAALSDDFERLERR